MHKTKRTKSKPAPPRAFDVRFSCILQERDGWTEDDLRKARETLDALSQVLMNFLMVPGVKSSFPRTDALDSHCHPSFLMCRNVLYHFRQVLTAKLEELNTARPK